MYFKALLIFTFLSGFVPVATACEGECIVAITKAFLGNYSTPINYVFKELAEQISTQLLPSSARLADPTNLLQPILSAYANSAYPSLETAIFPSYFHGKCQRFSKDGQDPPGCPNPDCPVVCGTPGSLVHFYSHLRYIAFNDTKTILEKLFKPGNPAYDQVIVLVKQAQVTGGHKRDFVATHGMGSYIGSHEYNKNVHSRHFGSLDRRRGAVGVQTRSPSLEFILAQFSSLFTKACGGNPGDSKDALPKCSWETDMKKYILSFP